jgi:hypothetical protein
MFGLLSWLEGCAPSPDDPFPLFTLSLLEVEFGFSPFCGVPPTASFVLEEFLSSPDDPAPAPFFPLSFSPGKEFTGVVTE